MKKNIAIWGTALILVVIAIFVTLGYSKNTNTENEKRSSTSGVQSEVSKDASNKDQAIDFSLTDLSGKKVSLKDFRGKNIYLNFWATWCPPCRGEMPDLEKIYQQYKNKDLVVLAVNIGEDKNTVEKFIKENNYNFNVLLDIDQGAAEKYSISSIPQSFFIDKGGKIIAKRIGAMEEAQMKEYVDKLYEKQ